MAGDAHPAEYRVMREEGTERAGSSPLDKLYAPGVYQCRGCDLPVYSSEAKYDSGTGWPSFWQSLPDAVRTKPDRSLFTVRTEVHCRRCGSHFGHIFDDGPGAHGQAALPERRGARLRGSLRPGLTASIEPQISSGEHEGADSPLVRRSDRAKSSDHGTRATLRRNVPRTAET